MKNNLIKIVASILMFLITLFISEPLIKKILFIIAYLIVGFNVLKKSIKNILKGEIFDENFLMSIATLGAFLIGEDEEALAVMLFYQIGELFNDYAVDKSKKSISKLMDIRPDYANLCIDDDIKKVDPSSVKIGDIIIVKPGEKIPLDGTIISGDTMIDTHALTGEAVLKHATINQDVLSGCINVNGVIKIEVKKKFKESTVNKILELVENASNKKSKSESFITRFSKDDSTNPVALGKPSNFIP